MRRLLLGVGNRLSRDDGAGPALAERLSGSSWTAIDCGTSLENAAGIVARDRPDVLVIVDAARMGTPPGTVRRLPRRSVDRMLATTHGLPIEFFLDRLASAARQVVILGIEPADLSLGEGLSTAADAAVRALARLLIERPTAVERIPKLGAFDRAEPSDGPPLEGAAASR